MAATGAATRGAGRFPDLAKYDVIEEIGHGGMATVYRARDRRLSRDVAVKVIHPHLRDSIEVAHRFVVEAQAVAKLRHPNIVEVFDVSTEDDAEQFLVVELVRGTTLRKLLQKYGAIPVEVAAVIALDLLAALTHAHASGVVHRDVKPENVMLEHPALAPLATPASADASSTPVMRADASIVKLTDFGIAKLLDAQGVTSTGQVLGSPAHMAPEQIEGGEVDARADVFGLGVLFYECVVGHLPFEGTNPAQVLRRVLEGIYSGADRERGTVGKSWSAILDRALAKNAADRYESANAMRDAIAAELTRVGVTNPRAELEAWCADPDAYVKTHDEKLIAKLCELGRSASAKGEAIAAATDYNRALAYAPHDQALMRIVASLHRVGERRRLVRRLAPMLLAMVAFGVLAFFVTKVLRVHAPSPQPVSSVDPAAIVPAPSASASQAPTASAPPVKTAPTAPVPAPTIHVPVVKPVERSLIIASVFPPYGVLVSLDGEPPKNASSGLRIAIDGKAHELSFQCVNDVCEPQTRDVPAGDEPEPTIAVKLQLKPAKLVVAGDPTMSYGLEEFPDIEVRAGLPASIPVKSGNAPVHIVERPSGHRLTTTLNPGQERRVSFLGDAGR